MCANERVAAVAGGWVEKAENDLKNASLALRAGEECPADTVAFHAQQCVEKYLKALLVAERIDFPKTHDIEKLVALLPARLQPRMTSEEQGRLTDYATGARYPGWGDISLAEARRAVAIARRVRREIRRVLPKEALRQRKK